MMFRAVILLGVVVVASAIAVNHGSHHRHHHGHKAKQDPASEEDECNGIDYTTADSPIYTQCNIHVKLGQADAFTAAFQALADFVKVNAPGVQTFTAAVSAKDPELFHEMAIFSSDSAFDDLAETEGYVPLAAALMATLKDQECQVWGDVDTEFKNKVEAHDKALTEQGISSRTRFNNVDSGFLTPNFVNYNYDENDEEAKKAPRKACSNGQATTKPDEFLVCLVYKTVRPEPNGYKTPIDQLPRAYVPEPLSFAVTYLDEEHTVEFQAFPNWDAFRAHMNTSPRFPKMQVGMVMQNMFEVHLKLYGVPSQDIREDCENVPHLVGGMWPGYTSDTEFIHDTGVLGFMMAPRAGVPSSEPGTDPELDEPYRHQSGMEHPHRHPYIDFVQPGPGYESTYHERERLSNTVEADDQAISVPMEGEDGEQIDISCGDCPATPHSQ